jgi:Ca2+/H+ antiporter, TMEM165/GDT1 family
MRPFSERKRFFIIPLILLGVTAIGFITMALWNAVLPQLFHFPVITFWQAICLLILSRLLFGGTMGPRGGHNHQQWRNRLREKWEKMTPEEREKFSQRMHHPWFHSRGEWNERTEPNNI